jgi:hypothetical protein
MTAATAVLLAIALSALCGWIGANVWERLKGHIGEKPAVIVAIVVVMLLASLVQPLVAALIK